MSYCQLTGYSAGDYPISTLTLRKKELELSIEKDDDHLLSEQRKSLEEWFEGLKEPQQK